MKLIISGKCSDMCDTVAVDDSGKPIRRTDSYVPNIPAIGGGDYIDFEVDVETGVIKDWDPQLVKMWAGNTDHEDDDDPREDYQTMFKAEQERNVKFDAMFVKGV